MLQSIIDTLTAHGKNIGAHDVAAGVHESILNAYSVAHHKNEHPKPKNPYKGGGDLPDLRLGYTFDIAKPVILNLSPTPKFNEEMERWMIQYGGESQPGLAENIEALLAAPQPNIRVNVPDIVLTFTLKTINKKIQISFSLTVLCFVTTDSANQIRIVPISAVVDDPQALEKAVKDAANKAGIPLGKKDATCFELWELVKYIINNTLADHVSQFIETIPLPSFIKVIDGVNLGNVAVVIIEKFIVATAMVSARMPKLLESDVIPAEDIKDHAAIMQKVAEAGFSKASAFASVMTMENPKDTARLPGQGFFLLFTQALFQKLANKYVNVNQGSESCSTFLGFIQGCAGWGVRVWNPRVSLQAPHLLADFDFSADGYVKARASPLADWVDRLGQRWHKGAG
jgi:hypothetical protein